MLVKLYQFSMQMQADFFLISIDQRFVWLDIPEVERYRIRLQEQNRIRRLPV